MTGTAAAQVESNSSEGGDVTVGVSSTIAVDVQPANLDYSNAQVGVRNTSSDRGFGAIEIENTGSEYINRIWLNTSVPTQDPFATGLPSAYDSGNFLEVRPQDGLAGDSAEWHYVNRKEYMSSDDTTANGVTDIPSFIQVDGYASAPYEVGSVRRGNETIYFAIDASSTDDTCNADTATLRVGNVSSTDSRLGTVDFTSSTEYGWTEYTLGSLSNSDYGAAGVELNWSYTNNDQPNEYDLLTRCAPTSEQPHVFVNRYNINTAGAQDISSETAAQFTQFLLDTDNAGSMLAPGELATVETAINVPEGVAEGSVDPGTLRVLITADEEAQNSP